MSASLDLDFVPKSVFALSNIGWIGPAMLLTGLMIAAFTWQSYQHQKIELLQITSLLNQINRLPTKKILPLNIVPVSITLDKKQQIEDAVAALTIPWNALLNAVEKPDMRDIALLSFTPNIKNQQLVLAAEAKNLQAALNYVDALQAQPVFDKVYLQKHAINEADISKPVKFNVFVHWQVLDK
jgi:hypothetical protein